MIPRLLRVQDSVGIAAALLIAWQRCQILWEKLTHPLIWPVDLGPPEQLLEDMTAKYNQDREVRHYSEEVGEGLDETVRMLVDGPMAKRGSVLDVGCGAGREAIALARLGYQVVGIDIASRMVEAAERNAREQGLGIPFMTLAAHESTPELGSFDYVVTTSGFYMFVPTRKLRIRTLQALKQVLKPGGTLFLSAEPAPPAYPWGLRGRFVDLLRRIPGKRLTAEPGDQLSGFVSPSSNPAYRVFLHVFSTRRDIEAEIREAGLIGEPIPGGMWELRQGDPVA